MLVKKTFPQRVACVHCNGGCRAKKREDGSDMCHYGCTTHSTHSNWVVQHSPNH